MAVSTEPSRHYFRFHAPHTHLSSVFGDDWLAVRAEGFARFFGTPTFLVAQTIIVGLWVALNVAEVTHFDDHANAVPFQPVAAWSA